MTYISKSQDALQLKLDTKVDLSGASTVLIKYKKPDGTTGEWAATKSTTFVIKEFIANQNELDQIGTWTFWSHAVFGDGRGLPGEPVKQKISEEGKE